MVEHLRFRHAAWTAQAASSILLGADGALISRTIDCISRQLAVNQEVSAFRRAQRPLTRSTTRGLVRVGTCLVPDRLPVQNDKAHLAVALEVSVGRFCRAFRTRVPCRPG
jgi:hypothetical protein